MERENLPLNMTKAIECVIEWKPNFAELLVLLSGSRIDHFGEYNVIITDRSDGQSYINKPQIVINCCFPLILWLKVEEYIFF